MTATGRWRRLSDLGLQLLDVREPEAFTAAALSALLEVVPADVAGDVELGPGVARITEAPDLLLVVDDGQLMDAVMAEHPALPQLQRTGEVPARRVEDLCGPDAWRRHPMRTQLLAPLGVPHALLTAHVTSTGSVRGWGVNRSRPFSDDDLEALAAFEPFLRRAVAQRESEGLVAALDLAVAGGAGLLVLQQAGAVHLNDSARAALDAHEVTPDALCRAVARWRVGETTTVPTAHGALRLHRRPSPPGTRTVVITAAEVAPPPTRSPLTSRQLLVLCHVAQGRTAEAIARHVGVSSRTVHKHLEHVYRRLRAHDRLDAVLRAQALGLLARCPPELVDEPLATRRLAGVS